MSYIYFLRDPNQADAVMPDGCTEVRPWQEPGYEQSVRCNIHGYVRFCRPLSTEEVAKHRLIPDPPEPAGRSDARMRPQLRECPCCGGAARRIRSKQYFIIQCEQCRLRATGTSWNDVERRWNLRATDAALEALRVKLRELNVKLDRLEGRSQ